MSSYRLKTKFNSEGPYGSTEQSIIYAHHNLSSDYVTFYDEHGDIIMVVPDTIDNNLLDAINRLYHPIKDEKQNLVEGVEYMNEEDRKKIGL